MTVKELRERIREHKAGMKRQNIPVSSFMNGGLSLESAKANGLLFRLKLDLEDAMKTKNIATPNTVRAFLELHSVTQSGFAEFGEQTRKAVVSKFNKECKTKLTVSEFALLVTPAWA